MKNSHQDMKCDMRAYVLPILTSPDRDGYWITPWGLGYTVRGSVTQWGLSHCVGAGSHCRGTVTLCGSGSHSGVQDHIVGSRVTL